MARVGNEERLRQQGERLSRLERHTDELGRRACRQEARLCWLVDQLRPAQKALFQQYCADLERKKPDSEGYLA